MNTLSTIEKQAAKFAAAREVLSSLVAELTNAMDALKADALPSIKRAIERAAEHHDRLRVLVEESPKLFQKPRSKVFHGIKLGFQKSKGKIEFEDADRVCALIKKHFPDQADVLIQTKEKPAKDALNNLTAAELKRLGINVTEGGDVVFIRPVDSAVDKMVDALLKAATEEPEEA
jgi:tryptophan 2,3-dioxygenase